MPRRMRPTMSMATSSAAALRAAPARKETPPPNMDHFRPRERATDATKKEATSAARYSDDVNAVSSWLSNLQYWLLLPPSAVCSLRYTDGKNLCRNASMDVTPPAHVSMCVQERVITFTKVISQLAL